MIWINGRDREDRDGMPDCKKPDKVLLEKLGLKTVDDYMDAIVKMARGPGRGTILVRMINEPGRECVRFEPTESYEYKAADLCG